MSSLRTPVGPQPKSVYWRRRALVAGAIVLVVVVIVLIVVGRGSGASSAAPTASATASPAAARTAKATPAATPAAAPSSAATPKASTPKASATAAAGASGSASAGAKSGSTCAKSQIQLKPITDATAYGPTEEPKISMSITNTGSSSCRIDLGSAQQVLTITSGTETYWSSKDCQTGGTDQQITIKAGQTLTTPSIAWDRTRSSTTTCDSSRPSVAAGGASYHLQVSVGNITSATSAQFVLN